MTIQALTFFLDISDETWANYCANKDFIGITTQIKKVIYSQKFEGAAADMLNHKLALWIAQSLLATGFAALALEPPYALIVMGCISIGLAAGGMLPVWGALTADLFGLQSYGRAFGLMAPIITVLVMVGFPLAGRLYDMTGSFSLCLWLFAAMMAVAAILLIPLRVSRAP